ncbi:MAG: hypothetical protein AAF547_15480 [Actinomycetota bacterium]
MSETEVAAYDVVPAEIARRVRIIRIPLIPGGYAGMTLVRTVLLARDVEPDGSSPLLAHELVHVRQWTEEGILRFSSSYLGSFLRNLARLRRWNAAYHQIDHELEAKQETTDWLRRRSRANAESEARAAAAAAESDRRQGPDGPPPADAEPDPGPSAA